MTKYFITHPMLRLFLARFEIILSVMMY